MYVDFPGDFISTNAYCQEVSGHCHICYFWPSVYIEKKKSVGSSQISHCLVIFMEEVTAIET